MMQEQQHKSDKGIQNCTCVMFMADKAHVWRRIPYVFLKAYGMVGMEKCDVIGVSTHGISSAAL